MFKEFAIVAVPCALGLAACNEVIDRPEICSVSLENSTATVRPVEGNIGHRIDVRSLDIDMAAQRRGENIMQQLDIARITENTSPFVRSFRVDLDQGFCEAQLNLSDTYIYQLEGFEP